MESGEIKSKKTVKKAFAAPVKACTGKEDEKSQASTSKTDSVANVNKCLQSMKSVSEVPRKKKKRLKMLKNCEEKENVIENGKTQDCKMSVKKRKKDCGRKENIIQNCEMENILTSRNSDSIEEKEKSNEEDGLLCVGETDEKILDAKNNDLGAEQKRKGGKQAIPCRSLTDEEYEEIFNNAITRAMNTPLDELFASLHKEVKQAVIKVKKNTLNTEVIQENSADPCNYREDLEAKQVNNLEDIVNSSHCIKAEEKLEKDIQKTCTDTVKACIKTDRKKPNKNHIPQCNSDFVKAEVKSKIKHQNKRSISDCTSCESDKKNKTEINKDVHNVEFQVAPDQEKKVLTNNAEPSTSQKKNKKQSFSKTRDFIPKKVQFPAVKLSCNQQELKERRHSQKIKEDVHKERMGTKDKKKLMLEREIPLYGKYVKTAWGTWVQCCNKACMKWRYLPEVHDPSELPTTWTCNMNADTNYNGCDKQEQEYNEEDHIFTNYSEGSIVWAKVTGYPWWPAMIEIDPDQECYFELLNEESMHPSHYHVVFFDDKVSRSWIRATNIQPFIGKENLDSLLKNKKGKGPSFHVEVAAAKRKACEALELSIQKRLKEYSFCKRFKGKWGKEDKCVALGNGRKNGQLKKRKRKYTQAEVDDEIEVVDDTTVDDMLNDPGSMLSSLDDVLDSLESLAEDPDFLPSDEEVWEEKENMSRREENREGSHRTGMELSRDSFSTVELTEKPETKQLLQLKFDPDVFTMDMESEEEQEEFDKSKRVTDDIQIHSTSRSFTDDRIADDTCFEDKSEIENECASEKVSENHSGKLKVKKTKIARKDKLCKKFIPKDKTVQKKSKHCKCTVEKQEKYVNLENRETSSVDRENCCKDTQEDIDFDINKILEPGTFELEEQTVPNPDDKDSPDFDNDLSMDFDDSLTKHQSNSPIHTIAEIVNQQDYSDPFDLIEE